MAPDWTWLPLAERAEPDLGTPIGADVDWPDWLGGPAEAAPVEAAPVELEAPAAPPEAPPEPPEAAAPPESAVVAPESGAAPAAAPEPPPELDPLTGAPAARGGAFPWETAEAEPGLEVDALSGGSPAPVADPLADPLAPQPGDASYTPEAAEQHRLSQLDPVAFAGEREAAAIAEEDRWRKREAELRAESLADDKRRRRENEELAARVRDEARAELDAIKLEAAELAQAEVDPGRWWSDASTSQKIGAGVAAIIGGLLSPYRGGKNTGIEFILGQIDRDIAAQRENLRGRRDALNLRRGLVGDLVDLGMEEHRAAEVARQAALQTVALKLAYEQAAFDRGGTTWLRIEGFKRQAQAALQKAAAEAEETLFQRNLTLHREARADAELRERAAANWRAHQRAEADRAWEREKLGLEEQAAQRAAAAELTAAEKESGIGGLIDPETGRTWVAPKSDASELRKVVSATDRAAEGLDDLAMRVERMGGWERVQSLAGKSKEAAELLVDSNRVLMALKDTYTLGQLTGGDIDLANALSGMTDLRSMRTNPLPALLRARDNIVGDTQSRLERSGYRGQYEPPGSPEMRAWRAGKSQRALDQRYQDRYGHSRAEHRRLYQQAVDKAERANETPPTLEAWSKRAADDWSEVRAAESKRTWGDATRMGEQILGVEPGALD